MQPRGFSVLRSVSWLPCFVLTLGCYPCASVRLSDIRFSNYSFTSFILTSTFCFQILLQLRMLRILVLCDFTFPAGLCMADGHFFSLWRGCVNICYLSVHSDACEVVPKVFFLFNRSPLKCEWCRSRVTEERRFFCSAIDTTRRWLKGNISAQVPRVLLIIGDWKIRKVINKT